jgi:hypothetical protein
MVIFILLNLLVADFQLKWTIPYGNINGGGRLLVDNTDHDSQVELIFRRWVAQSFGVYFAEFVPPDSWDIYESINVDSVLVWGSGDFDNDGCADLVTYGDASSGGPPVPIVSVYESPDSFSYPANEVWRDTVGFALVQPISTYDVDGDSLPEIFKLGWRKEDSVTIYYPFGIYESIGDNQYDTIFMGTGLGSLSSTIAFGDFDGDSLNEFVVGNIDGWYQIWECAGDNNYQLLQQQQLPTLNIKDCFSIPDADGDGRPEFVVKGYVIPSAEIHVFIFEAINDNTYEIIKTFTLPGGTYYGGYSDAGDVDGDSIPEIALEARQNVSIIKAVSNDSFYIFDSIPGNDNGSSIRVYDIDGNGLSEVIISGNDETRIYEYEVGVAENIPSETQSMGLRVSPNPFRDQTNIRYSIRNSGYLVQYPTLKIYDACGRLVRDFDLGLSIRNHLSAISWSGDDDVGRKLPGGVYFLTLTAGDYSATEKLLLIR